jgi:hypothetical protein
LISSSVLHFQSHLISLNLHAFVFIQKVRVSSFLPA